MKTLKQISLSTTLFILICISIDRIQAQNIGINGTGATAHSSALLDLVSNNSGFAMPRLTTAQRLAIASPVNGLIVYDTNLDGYYRFSTTNNKWDCATTPAGTVIYFANVTSPLGYVICDGSAVSRTTYPELFNAIGTIYGAGNGTTTFNLPDLRGEFIRGAALTGTVDAGRVFASKVNASQFALPRADGFGATFDGNQVGTTNDITFKSNAGQNGVLSTVSGYDNVQTINGNTTYNWVPLSTAGSHSSGYVTGGVYPKNIALLPCIKY